MRYIHYISAMRRLHEAEKTVIMLGGEREAPEMVRAQRDMIKLEKEYYADECVTMNFILIFVSIIGGLATFVYKLTHGSL
jgi:phage terminase Nu1 subunit (DNA packaging protein)